MFLPSFLGSQMNESAFRALRSMGTTFSTVVNFTLAQVIHRSNKTSYLDNHQQSATANESFLYPLKKSPDLCVAKKLLSNRQVAYHVNEAFLSAKGIMADLGCLWNKLEYPEPILTTPLVIGADHENEIDSELSDDEPEPECAYKEELSIPADVVQDEMLLTNLRQLLDHQEEEATPSEIAESFFENIFASTNTESSIPSGYLLLVKGGKEYLMRKSSLLFLLSRGVTKVPVSRLQRFIEDQRKDSGLEVTVGDFVIMAVEGRDTLCQVSNFQFKDAKRFHSTSCVVEPNTSCAKSVQKKKKIKTAMKGVNALVRRYNVDPNNCIHLATNGPEQLVDIACYKRHVSLLRHPSGLMQVQPARLA